MFTNTAKYQLAKQRQLMQVSWVVQLDGPENGALPPTVVTPSPTLFREQALKAPNVVQGTYRASLSTWLTTFRW